jgi:hypothetical protein
MSAPDVDGVYRRVIRRETHVSRTAAVSVLMVFVLLAAIVVVTGASLVLLDERLGGFDPRAFMDAVANAPAGLTQWIVIVAGGVAALVGLVLLLQGVLPQRRPRHAIRSARLAVIVDDEVIASATARAARGVTRLGPEAAVGTVGRRTAQVVVRPAAGADVPVVAVSDAVRAELDDIDPTPTIVATVRVQPAGRVDG